MAEVGKVTIETQARGTGLARHVNAIVNVGGSLVSVNCDSEQDEELAALVERLDHKLSAMALDTAHASLHHEVP